MISVHDLCFSFPDSDANVLEHIDLEIARGEWVVIIGASGCGKSTLALALGGFLFNQYPDHISGTVLVDGLDARITPLHQIADRVGLVQQNPESQFCTLVVEDELVFGLENRCLDVEEINSRLNWALEITDSVHLRQRSLASLSGGEKQKIAIAAMLASRPDVLIFDEPTSNLDPSATADIFRLIQQIRLTTPLTVIVIEHKINFLREFQPRLLEMRAGRITSDQPLSKWHAPGYKPLSSFQASEVKQPLLSVRNLHAGYDQRTVLEAISFDLHPGEFVAVMGDNGSGKSTLLQTIANLNRPSSGIIFLDGKNTDGQPVSQLAQSIGLVFQNPFHQLFARSVWDEALFASTNFGILNAELIEQTGQLLAAAGLLERKMDHPFRLSYGQMRRLNLISIFVHHPKLYLLDELLIGQDVENGTFLLQQLQQVQSLGAAILMVIHNPDAVLAFASRIIFLQSGQILFDLPVEAGFEQLARLGKTAYLPDGWGRTEVVR